MAKNNLYKNLYCIIGASGCGKTATVDFLHDKFRRRILKSYTTRPKRHEYDTDHIYISEEEYQQLKNKVATAEISGYHYCATQEQVDEADYYVVDWGGFEELLHKYKGKKRGIYIIYLYCSDEIRTLRMQTRGDNASNISQRLDEDKTKFSRELYEKYMNYILKTINTGNVTTGVVAGVINVVSSRKDRQTK